MADQYITRVGRVWIFGGGITGLSAAHELIERGFEVTVYEREPDPRYERRPAIGGVARTQFAWLPEGAAETARVTPLRAPESPPPRVIPAFRTPVLSLDEFDVTPDGTPRLGAENVDALHGLMALFSEPARAERVPVHVEARVGKEARSFGEGEGLVPAALIAKRFAVLVEQWIKEYTTTNPQCCMRLAGVSWSMESRSPTSYFNEADTVGSEGTEVRIEALHSGYVPGEHGFRYFPGFYRHLFDTMRRTVVTASDGLDGKRFWKSALDNLATTEATWLVVKDRDAKNRDGAPTDPADSGFDLVSFPRRQPRSLQGLSAQIQSFLRDLGYSASDLSRLSLKLFQYMTTSSERRAAEHEDSSWWDFIDGERFTEICRDHMDKGPEVLGAMTAKESDTRTQGNCVVQLLVDQILGREITDATLNGPTTEAWFDLWYEYLFRQGVRFEQGELVGFEAPSNDARPDVVLPVIKTPGGVRRVIPSTVDRPVRGDDDPRRDDWFIIATPGSETMGFPQFRREGDGVAPVDGLAQKLLAAAASLPVANHGDTADLEKVIAWKQLILDEHARDVTAEGDRRKAEARGVGPLRHLTGVQYFFLGNVQFGQEHTLYLDSPWRLSSISQTHFWGRLAAQRPSYRGIVSVDLGALHQPDGSVDLGALRRPDGAPKGVTAWECSPQEIAERVWVQVGPTVSVDTLRDRAPAWRAPVTNGYALRGEYAGDDALDDDPAAQRGPGAARASKRNRRVPVYGETLRPMAWHLDTNLVFERDANGAEVRVARNLTPYLINRPGEFRRRPGTLHDAQRRSTGYTPQNHRWLLAGTYLKTFTRLTTMEAANESARHAVNAILHARQVQSDRCMIWDPEACEIPDLAGLREVDRKLFLDGYPHMVDILGLESIPDALVPSVGDPGATP